MTNRSETLIDSWNFLCCFRRVIRNKSNYSESVLEEGMYIPSYSGMLRIGEKVSDFSSTQEIVEYTSVVFRPNFSRLYVGSLPTLSSFRAFYSGLFFNSTYSSANFILKLWANSDFIDWDSSTIVTYDDIIENYIPFNETEATYLSSVYENTIQMTRSSSSLIYSGIKNITYSLMLKNAIGFMITGTRGYVDLYSPEYIHTDLRPQLSVIQTVLNSSYNYIPLDTEIIGRSHVIGVCRDLNGIPVTSSECKVSIFDLSNKELIGSGLSNVVDGSFRIKSACKSNTTVLVTFANESLTINGSEIMDSFGSSSSSSSLSSSSSSSG